MNLLPFTTAGYYPHLTMADYLADPCPEPSLSTGVVHDLHTRTPLRAWTYHPQLGRRHGASTARGDIGSAVHARVLGGAKVQYGNFDNWTTKAAKEFRDSAREAGDLPILERQQEAVERAATGAAIALAAYGNGQREVTMCWQAFGVWQRGRVDFLPESAFDVDLKTVEDLDPDEWERRTIVPGGLDIQAGLRSIGHETITGKPRRMLWLLQDIEPPYDSCFVGLSPSKLAIATEKIKRASELWRRCLDTKTWPGYGSAVRWAEAKPWEERELAERASMAVVV